jgi:hypothetical protein
MAAPRKSRAAPPAQGSGKSGSIRLPREPKGRRAQFYPDPAIDQLLAIVVALTGELSVALDRIDTLERVLAARGVIGPCDVEAWVPDETASSERARRREELIERVFQVLSQYAQAG